MQSGAEWVIVNVLAFVQVNALPLPPFLPFYSLLASLKIVALVSVPGDPVTPFSGLDFIASHAQIFLGLGEINIAPIPPRQCWRRSSILLCPAVCGLGVGCPQPCRMLVAHKRCWERNGGVPKCHIAPCNSSAWVVLEDFLDRQANHCGFFCPSEGISFPLLNTPKSYPEKAFPLLFPPDFCSNSRDCDRALRRCDKLKVSVP